MPTSSPSPPPDDAAPGPNHMKAVLDSLGNLQGGRKRKQIDALDPYLKAARAFPLLHDPFVDLGTVFYDGISANHGEEVPEDDETPEEHKNRQYCIDVFRHFIKRIPSISATLGSFEDNLAKLENFINVLRNAASLAHAKDTCKLKDLCPSFLLDDPAKPRAALDPPIVKGQSKSLCGWNHKATAQALCPMVDIQTFDENPQAYMNSILSGERKLPSFKKLPLCLYNESLADPTLKCSGFLHGKPLERTFRAIFTGPLTALEPNVPQRHQTPKRCHSQHDRTFSPRYCLCCYPDCNANWTSEVTGLDLYELYISIVDSLKWTNHPWVKDTLDHWKKVAPRLTQTSQRKNGCRTTAASDNSDSDDMEGFLNDPPERSPQCPSSDCSNGRPSTSQCPSSPPPERQRQPTPPPERQHQLTPPPPNLDEDEDEDDRLTPPLQTPLVAKRKAPGPAKRGRAPHRRC
ncbi:hypothetical protein DFH29DRAFT_882781 [Suillus ampliporus]|nr:hypothetical protein DFH29DRAFT_882781 [Suillus ampliporus]